MNDLEILRQEIDKIDRELLPLFLSRMEKSKGVAKYKIENGLPVLDRGREREILENKTKGLSTEQADSVYRFYSSIMAISRSLQSREIRAAKETHSVLSDFERGRLKKDARIAFQGVGGANSEAALIRVFGENADTIPNMTFSEVIGCIKSGDAEYGILPIENSYTGTVADNYELIEKNKLSIVGEVDMPIEHCLMGVRGATLSDIRTIYSHEQGIMQCNEFLKTLPGVTVVPYFNTALSAKKIAGEGNKAEAAIADKRAAELYGLDIIRTGISSCGDNTTRFAIVAKNSIVNESCNKISLAFKLPNESGTLSGVLSTLATGGLNLTKIESRPLFGGSFEYIFFADVEGNLLDPRVRETIERIEGETSYLRLMGNYAVM